MYIEVRFHGSVAGSFVKGFRRVVEAYANMRQPPNVEEEKHSPLNGAIEVWNKNIVNGCLPKHGYQKRFRWRRQPEKHQSVLGNLRAKTIQCCIDSPKYLWECGTTWTVFTKAQKKNLIIAKFPLIIRRYRKCDKKYV